MLEKITVILNDFYHKLEKIKKLDNRIKLKSEIGQAKNPDVVARTSGFFTCFYSLANFVKQQSFFSLKIILQKVVQNDRLQTAVQKWQ